MVAMVTAAVGLVGCGNENPGECVSNDVGEVCAEQDNSAIRFNGQGLLPGSEVLLVSPALDPITFTADADGNPLTGQIEISTG